MRHAAIHAQIYGNGEERILTKRLNQTTQICTGSASTVNTEGVTLQDETRYVHACHISRDFRHDTSWSQARNYRNLRGAPKPPRVQKFTARANKAYGIKGAERLAN